MNIAIYGGAFDPIHKGHLDVAKKVMQSYKIDKFLFVPSFNSPMKYGRTLGFNDRCTMCNLSIKTLPRNIRSKIEVSTVEEDMADKYKNPHTVINYTYLLLEHLHKNVYPNDKLFLVVGGDSFSYIMSWKEPTRIFDLSTLIVIPREQYDYNRLISESKFLYDYGCSSIVINSGVGDISSTKVRDNYIDAYHNKLICKDVYKYIRKNGLYI